MLYTRALTDPIRRNRVLPAIEDARYLLDAALAARASCTSPASARSTETTTALACHAAAASRSPATVIRNADEVAAIWRTRGPFTSAHCAALAGCYDYASRLVGRG